MANDVFHRSQGYPDKRLFHPQREWGIGVLVFAILIISGSIVVGNIFVQYRGGNTVQGNLEEAIPQYREVIVQDALELYRARNEEYQRLRGNVAPVPLEVATSSDSAIDIEEVLQIEEEEGGVPELR